MDKDSIGEKGAKKAYWKDRQTAILEVVLVNSNTKLKKMGCFTLQNFINLKNKFLRARFVSEAVLIELVNLKDTFHQSGISLVFNEVSLLKKR